MRIQFILAAEVDITPAGIKAAATGVHYIAAMAAGLWLLLPEFLFLSFLDVLLF